MFPLIFVFSHTACVSFKKYIHTIYIYVFNLNSQAWWDLPYFQNLLGKNFNSIVLMNVNIELSMQQRQILWILLVKLSIPLLIPLHFTLFTFLYFVFAAFAFFFQEHSLPSINCTDIMLFLHSSEASYLNELIILHTFALLVEMHFILLFIFYCLYSMLFFRCRTPRWWVKPANGTILLLTLGIYLRGWLILSFDHTTHTTSAALISVDL